MYTRIFLDSISLPSTRVAYILPLPMHKKKKKEEEEAVGEERGEKKEGSRRRRRTANTGHSPSPSNTRTCMFVDSTSRLSTLDVCILPLPKPWLYTRQLRKAEEEKEEEEKEEEEEKKEKKKKEEEKEEENENLEIGPCCFHKEDPRGRSLGSPECR